jgi:hypothetical protein
VRQRGHRAVGLPEKVYLDYAPELLGGGLVEGGEDRDSGQVNPGVEPAVRLGCPFRHRLYLLEVRYVGRYRRRLATSAPDLLHQRHESLLVPG